MVGVEIVDADGGPAPVLVDRILESLKDDGVLLGKAGADRNVLAFQPPLIIEKEDLDEVVDKLERALGAAGEVTR
jgi:4-aminobutyrate aminotransferase-like enzyme